VRFWNKNHDKIKLKQRNPIKMKKISILATIIFSLNLLTNCSSKEDKTADFSGDPIGVTIAKTGISETGSSATASGKLVSKNSVNVSTRMMGYITSMPVQVGQSVRAGQQLVSINSTDIQAKGGQADAQIMQAQAAYDAAKKDYERFLNLFNSQSASQKELDDMKARFDMAAAGLNAAKQMKNEVNAQYKYTNITAPVSGVVTAKFAEQGDMASPGMPLLTIESPGVLQAQVMVSENNIAQVKNGMDVKILIKSSGKEIDGKVAEISQSSANTGGQYMVKINLPADDELRPGMYVNARFPFEIQTDLNSDTESVVIPKTALVKKGQLTGIYTVSSQNTAVLRWLKLGKDFGEEIEVLSGLSSDEQYIVSAEGRLYNGAKINVK